MSKQKILHKKTALAILAVVCLVALGSTLLVQALVNIEPSVDSSPSHPSTPANGSKINYGPPTQSDKDAGDQQKNTLISQPTPTSPTSATVSLSSSQYSDSNGQPYLLVNAIISNVVEESGTCTFAFSKGETSFTRTTSGLAAANSTQCGLKLSRSDFNSPGLWQFKGSYSSPSLSGQAIISMEVQ